MDPFASKLDKFAGGELLPERLKMLKKKKLENIHPIYNVANFRLSETSIVSRGVVGGLQSLDTNNLEYEPSEAGRGGHVQGLTVSLLASGEPGSEPRGLDNVE